MRLKAIYDLDKDQPYSNEIIRSNECYFELLCADIYDKPRVAGFITTSNGTRYPVPADYTITDIKELFITLGTDCQYDEVNNKLTLTAPNGTNRTFTITPELAKSLGLPTIIKQTSKGDSITGTFAPRGIRYIILKSDDISMTDTQAEGLDTKTLCIFTPGNNFSYVNYNVADQIPIVSNKTMRFSLVDNFGNTITDRKCCIEFILDTVRRHEKTSGYFRIGQRYRMPRDITKVALAEVVPLARTTTLTEDMLDYYILTYNKQEPKYKLNCYRVTSVERCTFADDPSVMEQIGRPITKNLIKLLFDGLPSDKCVAGYNKANNKYCIILKHQDNETGQEYDWRWMWQFGGEAIGLPSSEIQEKLNARQSRAGVTKNHILIYFPPQSILSMLNEHNDRNNGRYIVVAKIEPEEINIDGYRVPNFHPYLQLGSTDGKYINFTFTHVFVEEGTLKDFPDAEDHLDFYINNNPICRLNYEEGLLQQKNVAYFEMIEQYPTNVLEISLETRTRQNKDAADCFVKLFLKA